MIVDRCKLAMTSRDLEEIERWKALIRLGVPATGAVFGGLAGLSVGAGRGGIYDDPFFRLGLGGIGALGGAAIGRRLADYIVDERDLL